MQRHPSKVTENEKRNRYGFGERTNESREKNGIVPSKRGHHVSSHPTAQTLIGRASVTAPLIRWRRNQPNCQSRLRCRYHRAALQVGAGSHQK
mmetsp:Transcript_30093/g.55920  ORF Transcript_30093/g.55920 Transcript_30093/m.55920 type:complete len:93 (+) Transcript_30093:1712-1990(+)